MQLVHEFSTEIFDWWTLWMGQLFVFNPQLALKFKDENYVEVYGVLVSLNLEMSCLNSAASLVQWWVQASCSSSAISSEDQVC